MPVSYDFSGKAAVVTGGSKGIGRAICHQLKLSGRSGLELGRDCSAA